MVQLNKYLFKKHRNSSSIAKIRHTLLPQLAIVSPAEALGIAVTQHHTRVEHAGTGAQHSEPAAELDGGQVVTHLTSSITRSATAKHSAENETCDDTGQHAGDEQQNRRHPCQVS